MDMTSIFDFTGTSLAVADISDHSSEYSPTEALTPRPNARQSTHSPSPPLHSQNTGRSLYFDIETVPDEIRGGHLGENFGLDPLRSLPPETKPEHLLRPDEFVTQDLDAIRKWFAAHNPPEVWVDQVIEAERAGKKPRKGLLDAIDEWQSRSFAIANEESERVKLLSVTPEYCRVVALGWAIGGGPIESLATNDELVIVRKFWELVARHSPLIGFNAAGFDLVVMQVRSVLLGVKPTKCFAGLKPWDTSSVVDLMISRFPKSRAMKLKDLARLYGIEVPAGETSGGEVYELVKAGEFIRLGEYVRSDVHVTRELHRRWVGTFCSQ